MMTDPNKQYILDMDGSKSELSFHRKIIRSMSLRTQDSTSPSKKQITAL